MKEMICIEYPKTKAGKRQWGKEYGMNAIYAGKHWSRRKADSEYWHSLTQAALVRAGIPQRPAPKPVSIDFWWDDRLDLDNHAYMAKMIVDALKGWVIQDDNRRCRACGAWAVGAKTQQCVLHCLRQGISDHKRRA